MLRVARTEITPEEAVAMVVANPEKSPAASPSRPLALLMEATAVTDEDQVPAELRSRAVPFEKVPTAVEI